MCQNQPLLTLCLDLFVEINGLVGTRYQSVDHQEVSLVSFLRFVILFFILSDVNRFVHSIRKTLRINRVASISAGCWSCQVFAEALME